MATWSPRTFSFEQVLAAAHMNEIRDFLNRVAPAKVTAKGDLVVGSEAYNVSRLGVGSNNQVLVADSAESLGVKWGTVGGACRITRDTTESISTQEAIEFETEDFDTNGFVDLVSDADRITIPTGMAGIYQATVHTNWALDSTTYQVYIVRYNSSDVKQEEWQQKVTSENRLGFTAPLMNCSVGDYIRLEVACTTTENLYDATMSVCLLCRT